MVCLYKKTGILPAFLPQHKAPEIKITKLNTTMIQTSISTHAFPNYGSQNVIYERRISTVWTFLLISLSLPFLEVTN